jgi:hypothetical protein
MSMRRLYPAAALLAFLDHEAPLPPQVRPHLAAQARFPTRRTGERRLAVLPQPWPGLIGGGGRHVGTGLRPGATQGGAVACDSTPLATDGGVWHQTPREPGVMPHRASETEAGGSTAGWHGGWYGWQWHLAVTVGTVWMPLAAELPGANRGAKAAAPRGLAPLPWEVRAGLGATQSNGADLPQPCYRRGGALGATRRGPSPHQEGGAGVRKGFHQLRSPALEPLNGLCKNVCAWRVKMPVKGLQRTQLLAVGAVGISPRVLCYPHTRHLPLGKGINPLLRAACIMTTSQLSRTS